MAKKAKPYYKSKSGGFTTEQGMHFAKYVNHPGYKGDSYLEWALNNVNIEQSVTEDMRDSLKFGPGVTPRVTL